VAARHLDGSIVGRANLFPGASTPAKVGETISLYGTGFGQPVATPLTEGSVTQSGPMQGIDCWISGVSATAAGALVGPGLYQINMTIPNGLASGDNLVNCVYRFYPTFPGTLIAIQ
jgi:uncharacterized protein (TIGR03437 family)